MANEIEWLRHLAETNPALIASLVGAGTGGLVGGFSSDEGEETRGAAGGALLGGALGAGGGLLADKSRAVAELLTPTKTKALVVGGSLGGALGGRYAKSTLAPWIKERLMEANINTRSEKRNNKEASVMEIKQAAPGLYSAGGVPHRSIGKKITDAVSGAAGKAKEKATEYAGKAKDEVVKQVKKPEVAAGLGAAAGGGATYAAMKKKDDEKEASFQDAQRVAAFDFGMEVFLKEKGIDKEAFAKEVGLGTSAELAPATIKWLNQTLNEKK
jgi:hypothetical protein